MREFFVRNQQKIAIGTGYVLVFLLAFGLGKITTSIPNPPEIVIEEPSLLNSNPEVQGIQTVDVNSESKPTVGTGETVRLVPQDGECGGKIKGNIGSSGKIYHVPGGASYKNTDAEECFETESEAVAAGYRKASR